MLFEDLLWGLSRADSGSNLHICLTQRDEEMTHSMTSHEKTHLRNI